MTLYIEKAHYLLFDLHLWSQPLIEPEVLQPAFRFLADCDEYQKRFSESRSEGDHLAVRPMLREMGVHGHSFWKAYRKAVSVALQAKEEEVPCWEGAIPLFCRPKEFDLSFSDGLLSAEVSTFILLWPFGWSTNLGITFPFKERLPLARLWRLSQAIRIGHCFLHGDARWNLSKVFIEAGHRLKDGVLAQGRAFKASATVDQYCVAAITSGGTIPPYFPGSPRSEALGVLSDADRARLLSALSGRKIPVEKVVSGGSDPVSWVSLNSGQDAYALVDFDHGCLLVLPDPSSPADNRSKSRVGCTASGTRSMLLMLLALHGQEMSAARANGAEKVQALGRSAANIVESLRTSDWTTNSLHKYLAQSFNPRGNRFLQAFGRLQREAA